MPNSKAKSFILNFICFNKKIYEYLKSLALKLKFKQGLNFKYLKHTFNIFNYDSNTQITQGHTLKMNILREH